MSQCVLSVQSSPFDSKYNPLVSANQTNRRYSLLPDPSTTPLLFRFLMMSPWNIGQPSDMIFTLASLCTQRSAPPVTNMNKTLHIVGHGSDPAVANAANLRVLFKSRSLCPLVHIIKSISVIYFRHMTICLT